MVCLSEIHCHAAQAKFSLNKTKAKQNYPLQPTFKSADYHIDHQSASHILRYLENVVEF